MLVFSSSQHPSEVQKLVAEVLDIPLNIVIVDTRRMGGGFGGKETQAAPWACIAALLANQSKRSVKLKLNRSDDMCMTGKRHPFENDYSVGFDSKGQIKGININVNGNCGYSPYLSDAIVDRAMFHSDNAYYLDQATVTGNRCKLNTVSHTAYRGFGGSQGMMTIEMIMDDIARYLGKDPLEIRKINLYGTENRNETHYHQKVEHNKISELIASLEQSSDYRVRRESISLFNRENTILKKGIALTPVKFGISFTVQNLNQAGALVHVYTDGTIHLNHGGTEMGQGLFTKVAQIVAEEFQVDVDTVGVSATRTDKVPNTSSTAASSGTDLNGKAAQTAAKMVISQDEISQAILKRADFSYLGLIASETKWRRFKQRYKHRGVDQNQVARMSCPIGLEQIGGKLPIEVAVSVSAEIICKYQSDVWKIAEQNNQVEQVLDQRINTD